MIEVWTTEDQEIELQNEFDEKFRLKQLELDAIAAETKRMQKYTAAAYISDSERVFYYENGHWNVEINSTSSLVTAGPSNGRCYVIGPLLLPPKEREGLMAGKLAAKFENKPGLNGPAHGDFFCTIVDRFTKATILQLISDDDLFDL